MPTGIVIRSTGSWIDVLVDPHVIRSRIRGRMRLIHENETQPVAIGDHVSVEIQEDETGYITEVHARENHLFRRAAGRKIGKRQILVANVDQLWLIQAAQNPCFNPGLVDRIFVACEAQEIPAGLIINKIDLASDHLMCSLQDLASVYQKLGYPVLLTSVNGNVNLDLFRDSLSKKTSILLGPSGVGKSSLLNSVAPKINIPVDQISKKTNKGRHTTAHATLYPLPGGGRVADTPGIREFGLLDIEPWELGHYFPDFRPHLEKCHYPACTHDHEPDCGIKVAQEMGIISDTRYSSYLNILFSLRLGKADTGR